MIHLDHNIFYDSKRLLTREGDNFVLCFKCFGNYVLLTELPTYMKNVLHWDLKSKVGYKIFLKTVWIRIF